MKTFKRIGAAVEASAAGDEMTLSETTTAKLMERTRQLETELGFDITPEQTIAYLLRNIEAPGSSKVMDREAEALMRAGKKIDAIKLVRSQTHLGLKEAKDYVENRWQNLYVASGAYVSPVV